MQHVLRWLFISLGAGLLGACGDSTDWGAPATSSAAPAASADLPVPADFEESADQTISKENYEAELDALEAELGK